MIEREWLAYRAVRAKQVYQVVVLVAIAESNPTKPRGILASNDIDQFFETRTPEKALTLPLSMTIRGR